MELDLRFIGGTKGPVNFCCVMNGCSFACCGDQRSSGFIFSNPRTKSMKATRLFISRSLLEMHTVWCGTQLTSIYLTLLHILPWH